MVIVDKTSCLYDYLNHSLLSKDYNRIFQKNKSI